MGLRCLPSQASGNPLECEGAGGGLSCTPLPTVNNEECDLGTACQVAANGTDPCNPAGYVCDAFLQTCRQPLIYEPCVPGGPKCQGVQNSTVDDLACITRTNNNGNYSICLQPCRMTSDCIRGSTSCARVGNQGFACFGNYDGCTNYFGACNATGTNDGTCTPTKLSTGVVGECIQADVDAGTTCSVNRNRQNGGFCAVGEACVSGLCQPSCNAGVSGTPACSSSSATCASFGSTGDTVDNGACLQRCDFTDPDGGGCPMSPTPERCNSDYIHGFGDDALGYCASGSSHPLGFGAQCNYNDSTISDPCGPDLACGFSSAGETCMRLCKGVGGQGTCPTGQSCRAWYSNNIPSAYVGTCN